MSSETDYFEKVRQRIKEEREKAGMSQTELSNKVGASGLSLEILISEQEKTE